MKYLWLADLQPIQANRKYCKMVPRYNAFHLEMIPEFLRKQIFSKPSNIISEDELKKCLKQFRRHSFEISTQENSNFDITKLKKLPKLNIKNQSIEEHIWQLGLDQSEPYRKLIVDFITAKSPKRPTKWLHNIGWTKYVPGQQPTSVSFPQEDIFVFDVEVCVRNGPAPTLATAMSSTAWYCWISHKLFSDIGSLECKYEDLISIEDLSTKDRPRVIIGHNVGYDRIRIREQYLLERSALRFLDTMSIHNCISGITSYQRNALKAKDFKNSKEFEELSSLNSLSEVAKLYCKRVILKDPRDIFVKGTLNDIQNNLNNLINYCSSDCEVTFEVFQSIYEMFQKRFPHPVTLAGMLELSTSYLPVNSNWTKFIEKSDIIFNQLQNEQKLFLMNKANQAVKLLEHDQYKNNLWLWNQDWTLSKTRSKLQSAKRDICISKYPKWYRKLCEKSSTEPSLLTMSMRITPLLLNLMWEGYPLYHHAEHGWGFLVPFTTDLSRPIEGFPLKSLIEKCPVKKELSSQILTHPNFENLIRLSDELKDKNDRSMFWKSKKSVNSNLNQNIDYKGSGIWTGAVVGNCCFFYKLPHKDGIKNRVGNPLSKQFFNQFSSKLLSDDNNVSITNIVEKTQAMSYWRNNRDRILDQLVVWSNENQLNAKGINDLQYGAILPQVVVCGTLTRRAVERCWMTASKSQEDRIGSELRAMIQAPDNYRFVGADVDSQELWIAGLLGDSFLAKVPGCTPFSWMALKGDKANQTDMHSVTAKTINISREHAKVLNYARIYGAGQQFSEQLLQQFNPKLSPVEAKLKSRKMFEMTKGKKIFKLKDEFLHLIGFHAINNQFSVWQAMDIAKRFSKNVTDVFEDGKWTGGLESDMFNCLEFYANQKTPKTPFLDSCLSRALEPKNLSDIENDRFLPTRINWVVQSGAVDFLHVMLVVLRSLLPDPRCRFCLSFHDEIRFLVPKELTLQAVVAMHLSNLMTRSFFSSRLGIYDLPLSVAFFSSVEVDQAMRKDALDDCVTPSNPHGLRESYKIEPGKSYDIFEALQDI